MFRWITSTKWLALGLLAASFSVSAQQQFAEGKDFQRLKNPQAVESGAKIEVIEFFSYGCGGCFAAEEFIGPWIKKVPADVSFKRVPVTFQPAWQNLGKIYYTLEALGREDLSGKVFESIHKANVKLTDEKTFFDWAATNGLDSKKVNEMWNSFSVNSKMNRAKTLASSYQVDTVPLVFVDGSYKLSPLSLKNGAKDTGDALNFLISKARSARKQ